MIRDKYKRVLQYDPDDIDVRLQHFILEHIIQMIKDKRLIINSDMRDSNVSWTRKQKSLFIESLLIKLPIPIMYFDGSHNPWIIIDGFQRLSAIYEFIQNKFRLESLEYLKDECENSFFDGLPGYLQARIFETKIVAYVINPGTHEEVAYNIFRRINENGTHLNGQEIRHAFFHRQANGFVKALAELPLFCELKKGRLPSRRMRDREYVNRFVSFLFLQNDYDGNMEDFLYKGMSLMETSSSDELDYIKESFLTALERSSQLFGEYLFRTPLSDNEWSVTWNKAIYDMCMYCILKLDKQQMQDLLSHKDAFLNDFIETFAKGGTGHLLINSSNNSRKVIMDRFFLFESLLNQYYKS